MNRRQLLCAAAALPARAAQYHAIERNPIELAFRSGSKYDDEFNRVEVDVVFSSADGGEFKVPAWWAGEGVWRVRFAPPAPGVYRYRSIATDTANPGLHGQTGTIQAEPYSGKNPLYRRGGLRIAASKRYLEHLDGTPFFWLGDAWWMGLTSRLRWPQDFQQLAADRARKGFSVIQIVAGLFPDMDSFDPRGRNEAGFSWEPGYARINPAFFDMADLRIPYLVDRGLLPCIVGCWGYYLPRLGERRMRQHWRYLVARWGAWPVIWCLAGEGSMPWYLSERKEQEREELKAGWTQMARYLRQIDPYRRPITIHPSRTARDTVTDATVLDFDMLQTGHSDRKSVPNTTRTIVAERAAEPRMPVVNGEVCYEGIFEACREEMQRFYFWSCMLSGAAGFTYGANGIWQVNTGEQPYGPSPHGRTWGNRPWDEAAALPGSGQLGHSAALLQRYPWWRFEPHPEWIEPHWTPENFELPYAAGIPGEVRIAYLPQAWNQPSMVLLDKTYRAFFFNPSDGARHEAGIAKPESGKWKIPTPPVSRDWVVVLEQA